MPSEPVPDDPAGDLFAECPEPPEPGILDDDTADRDAFEAGWWDRNGEALVAQRDDDDDEADLRELAALWNENPGGVRVRHTPGPDALEYAALLVRALERAEATQARLDAGRVWMTAELVKSLGGAAPDPIARLEAPGLAASEIAAALRIPQRTARAKVEEARALCDPAMAPLLERMRDGSLNRQRAAIALDAAAPVPTGRLADFAEAAAEIAAPADPDRVPTPAALGRRLRRLAEDYADEPLAARKAKAAADRHVDITPAGDGMCHLVALLPLEQGALIDTRLGAIARSLHSPDEARTINQLRADAFRDLLLGSTPPESESPTGPPPRAPLGSPRAPLGSPRAPLGGVRMQLVVTATEATLTGASRAPGEILGYGPIDADTARNLAAQTQSWSRLAVGGKDGAPLSIGRIRYAPTAAMRRFLALRDATCRFPGCDKPSAATDTDHTIEWAHGGTTGVDNLALLCPEHHRLKSLAHWTVRQTGTPTNPTRDDSPATTERETGAPPGTLEWTSPSGRKHTTYPHIEHPPPF
ncbi:HNH endonuclease signature motif containing protein [Sinomonas cyclohexanicum]|uniref:HNH endonuclease signature motif containing protein n=1 Tax=Sinomonas cyclohexanicum TaxID=322009 RepID=UPI001E61E0CA|nr:HNH endonuclease signature motif containing protein [Corynebacterium cyclohexanicum]